MEESKKIFEFLKRKTIVDGAGTMQSNGNYITIQKLIEEYLKEKGYGN